MENLESLPYATPSVMGDSDKHVKATRNGNCDRQGNKEQRQQIQPVCGHSFILDWALAYQGEGCAWIICM